MEYRQPRKQSVPIRTRDRWSPPPRNRYKINFDSTVFKDEDRAGIGVIIQDSQGMVIASLSQNIPLPYSIVELEAIAASGALEFSVELGFEKAILEGGSEIVMKALKDDSSSLASFGLLIWDAQMFACLLNGNPVAHNLVRHSYHVTSFSVCMEDVPFHTFAAYQADLLIS